MKIITAISLLCLIPAGTLAQTGWLQQASGTAADLYGLEFLDTEHGWASGAGGTILRTTDGGATWSPQASGSGDILLDIDFAELSWGLCVGTGGSILRTTNGGGEWIIVQDGFIGTYHGVDMVGDAVTGYAVGVNGIFQPIVAKTINGGVDWTFNSFYIDGNEGTLTDVRFIDPAAGFATAVLWNGQGAVVRTTDGGTTWEPVYTIGAPLYAIDFFDALTGVATGEIGYVHRTEDGGETWELQVTGGGVAMSGVAIPDPAVVTIAGELGTIRRTETAGSHWQEQESGTSLILRDLAFPAVLTGYAVGDGGVILKTETGGYDPSSAPDPAAPRLGGLAASPNPFGGSTTLRWNAPEGSGAVLELFDVSGRIVRTVVPAGGTRSFTWDGRDGAGKRLAGGVVFARLTARSPSGLHASTARLVLARP